MRRQQLPLRTNPENRPLLALEHPRDVVGESTSIFKTAPRCAKAAEVAKKWISSDLLSFHESVYFSAEQVVREMHWNYRIPPRTVIHVGDDRGIGVGHARAADPKCTKRSANYAPGIRDVDSFEQWILLCFDQHQTRERTDGPER